MLAVLLVGSINYALALGFALTFLLAGLGLAAMVHTARNLSRIAVTAGRAEPVYAGESAQFRLYLDGRSAFDRPALLARHLRSGSQAVVDIPPLGVAEVLLAVPAPRRGLVALGRVMLETRFPLGLFRAWSYIEPDARCVVYPRPERSPLPPFTGSPAPGSLHTPMPGSDDFAGLRSYQRTDSPRHVAWKRSEEHTSELQSLAYLVCRLLLEKKKKKQRNDIKHQKTEERIILHYIQNHTNIRQSTTQHI